MIAAPSRPDDGLFSLVNAMFLINLPSRTDRRREFDAQLQRIGLALDHPKVILFPAIRPTELAGFPTIGARGCYLSHLGVLERATEMGLNSIVVCEDDLDFSRDFNIGLNAALETLRREPWDIFYGGYSADPALPSSAGSLVEAPAVQGVGCTHFMLFQGRVIAELREYLIAILRRSPGDPDGGPMHLDGAISRFRADHPEFRTLLAVPPLGHQRASRTDVHELPWFDRMPGLRQMAKWGRRLKHNLATRS